MLHDNKSNEAYVGTVISRIKSIRKLYQKAEKETTQIFKNLAFYFEGADLSKIGTKAENANNLSEAITRYLQYGEFDLNVLEQELLAAMPKDE